MNKTLRNIVLGVTLVVAGTLMVTNHNNIETDYLPKNHPSETTFITTSESVRIEPYYGANNMLMEGIVVTKLAYGNGLRIQNIVESNRYERGSTEYEALRPLLTVEHSK